MDAVQDAHATLVQTERRRRRLLVIGPPPDELT
jgi:hypothetical protein